MRLKVAVWDSPLLCFVVIVVVSLLDSRLSRPEVHRCVQIAVLETHGKIAEAGEIFCGNLYIVQYHLGKNGRNKEIMLGQI